jgi:enoyl-CoA hydratase
MSVVMAERRGAVLRVTLNRPERLNAVSEELYTSLLDQLAGADADPGIRCVLLTGAGRAFCVGADLKAHGEGSRSEDDRERYVDLGQRVCAQIQRMGTPVVAAVRGYALGAGAEMAVSADFLVAASDAQMGFPEVSIGTFVGGGVTHRLPRLVGLRKATELLVLGERFTGAQAAEWGLVHAAVAPDRLDEAADELAAALVTKAPVSLARMKRALLGMAGLDAALRQEAADLLAVMRTEDWAEGVRAFADRRAPVFNGR